MEKDKKEFWFPAMTYGIGWGLPVTWQGWVVLLIYNLLMIVGGVYLSRFPGGLIIFLIFALILSALLIFICWKKGEEPGLRWGNPK